MSLKKKKLTFNRSNKVKIQHESLTDYVYLVRKALSAYEKELIIFNLEPHSQDQKVKTEIRSLKEKEFIELNYAQLSQFKKIIETYMVVQVREGITNDVSGEGTLAKVIRDRITEGINSLKNSK